LMIEKITPAASHPASWVNIPPITKIALTGSCGMVLMAVTAKYATGMMARQQEIFAANRKLSMGSARGVQVRSLLGAEVRSGVGALTTMIQARSHPASKTPRSPNAVELFTSVARYVGSETRTEAVRPGGAWQFSRGKFHV